MKKQFLVLSFLLIAIIQGCSFQDHVVPGPGILPDAIRKIIDERYPGHSELEPSALEKDKVFLIRFNQHGSTYTLISNKNEILEAQRAAGNPSLSPIRCHPNTCITWLATSMFLQTG